jgi:hypothetical protein
LYDTDSLPTDPIAGCDCMGYRQHIAGGFTAMFGNTSVRADDYVVQVKNNLNQPSGPLDTISVRFSGGFSPPLASPLWVNGNAYPTSWFQVNVDGPKDTFTDASLPQSLDLRTFSSIYNFLDDVTGDLQIGVLFRNDSLSAFTTQPGDYDSDGQVAGGDDALWQSTFGSASVLDADGNRNGVVDAADYVIWRKNVSGALNDATVPEPNMLFLLASELLILASGFAGSRRNR